MKNEKRLEIMAPVGSFASLEAAIKAGADSVYFGVTELNMRARSSANFLISDMKEIVKRAKKANVLTYLTVNTILFDHDIQVARELVDSAKSSGIDAIIAFDFSVLNYCNQINMPVYCSVQFSISNYEAVKFFSKMTNRIILARELTLEQIKNISKKIKKENLLGNQGKLMEIEVFGHGALCIAQSGRCWMSLYTYNASANRGLCLQNCRRKYRIVEEDKSSSSPLTDDARVVKENKFSSPPLTNIRVVDEETKKELVLDNQYVMSAADICTIDFLDKFIDAGISVLKIEGRGRSPEYVYTVVKTYRQALKDIKEGNYTKEKISKYFKELKKVFNRKLSHGNFFLGKKIGEYSDTYGSKATEKRIYKGKVTHFFSKAMVAEIILEAGDLKTDENFLFTGEKTGVVFGIVEEIRIDDKKVKIAPQKSIISIKVPEKVRKNDRFYVIIKKAKPQEC